MKIIVCVKVVKGELNPFDKSALECALTLSDDVTVLCMGPKSCEEVIKPLTRLGAKAVLVSDNVYAGSDTLATSYILSCAIKNMEFDLLLCGRQSIDGDTAQVGPMLSNMLGINLITNAMTVNVTDDVVSADTRNGIQNEKLPALVTVERSYILRFPSIFSKIGDVDIWDNNKLKCDVTKCGLDGSPTKVLKAFENIRGKRKCKFISFSELDDVIQTALKQNKEEVINKSEVKLKSVWAVGDEVYSKAEEIADEVIKIPKSHPLEIAKMALDKKPDVILWNADLWGRKNAPIAASALETGLCADCTLLETDGENLYMYRPAGGGNITAKIMCTTKPQMATVRTKSQSSEIVVSGGKGIIDKTDKLNEFAKKLNATLGASRGLVDAGKAPYDNQVGLTGKTISPKIYIAIGISGAVHHTCAIEGADTVIAINPDRDARIFEYADYGILEEF